jgi:alpha-N-arabinofuranosidase
MNRHRWNRRDLLKAAGVASAAATSGLGVPAVAREDKERDLLAVDPKPLFELSPYLYMQFMEPLGVTDSSVDAAWDFIADRWRPDVVEITKTLAPTLMRWGGCFASYYRWREAVGSQSRRKPMHNLLWGGIYNNQVGTHEFVDLCRQVGADPLIVVNFESDGHPDWAVSPKGGDIRSGNAQEAAEWVAYCNDPDNAERIGHGRKEPYGVKLWQIGNETSYGGEFTAQTAAAKMVTFAKAMRKADPGIELIAWGEGDWVGPVCEAAGEYIQYIAYHNGFGPGGEGSPLHGIEYRKDPDLTWEYLLRARQQQEGKIRDMRERVKKYGKPLAMTECHFGLPGRNRNEVLSTWAAGVANATVMNVHERNGDVLKVATLADFCGTRWENNAVMIPVPGGRSYLMPVAMVMSLYRKHTGKQAVKVTGAPDGLDAVASRSGDKVFLHVVNTNRTRSVQARFAVAGAKVSSGRAFWFALQPEFEIFEHRPEHTIPQEKAIEPEQAWVFPPASVSAVELSVEGA